MVYKALTDISPVVSTYPITNMIDVQTFHGHEDINLRSDMHWVWSHVGVYAFWLMICRFLGVMPVLNELTARILLFSFMYRFFKEWSKQTAEVQLWVNVKVETTLNLRLVFLGSSKATDMLTWISDTLTAVHTRLAQRKQQIPEQAVHLKRNLKRRYHTRCLPLPR